MRSRDPATLTPAERLAKIAAILATGYGRLRIQRDAAADGAGCSPNPLDDRAPVEAPCDAMVNGREATPPKEADA